MNRDDLKAICVAVVSLAVLFAGVGWIGNRVEWISSSTKIEQLRTDAGRVNAKMAEDVAGQVSQWNQTIASKQRWRKTVFRFLIPSGWDYVKPIDMPPVE